jgi:hypothetical protein
MDAMDLRTLRTACLLAPEGSADYDADRYAAGKPNAHVSRDHSEYRTQRRSQRDAQSMQFRFVRHNRSPKGFRFPASGSSTLLKPNAGSRLADPSLRLRLITGL